MPRFITIAAHDPDLVIGKDGELPWRIPEDLRHFKNTTMGKPMLMGRGVFEEFNEKPLPGRPCYVLTSGNYSNVTTFRSIEEAVNYFEKSNYDEVFIIGGGQIYKQTMDLADRLIITEVHQSYGGDVFFPEYRHEVGKTWQEIEREDHDGFSFVTYERG